MLSWEDVTGIATAATALAMAVLAVLSLIMS
jgi:hypothetical protein